MVSDRERVTDGSERQTNPAERVWWLWGTLRRWIWLLVLLPVVAFALTYEGLSHLVKPLYTATVTAEVNVSSVGTDVSGTSVIASQNFAPTEAQLIDTMPVAMAAYNALHLHRPLRPRSLIHMCDASAIGGSALISISCSSHNPGFAAKVANAMGKAAVNQEQIAQNSRFATARGAFQQHIQSYKNLIGTTSAAINKPGVSSAAKARGQQQITKYRAAIATLNTDLLQLIANESQSATSLVVRVPATKPNAPVSPRPVRDGALAALAVLVLSGLVVFLKEYLSTTVGSPEEISRALGGAHVMGGIQRLPGDVQHPELIVASQPRAGAAEAYRVIRTNTLYSNPDRPVRIILVTSARQSEGKTTTAINVAASFAELGGRTLLVDADLRRPAVHRGFDIPNTMGLTSAIIAPASSLDAAIQETKWPNLYVLPSGPIPPNPSELLSSRRTHELMETLKSKFDHIVLDSPPVLPVADPVVLATMSDCVLLVLDVNQATRQTLVRTHEALARVGTQISGVILNNMGPDRRAGYYYHYYYGGDTYPYGGDGRKKSAVRRGKERTGEPTGRSGSGSAR